MGHSLDNKPGAHFSRRCGCRRGQALRDAGSTTGPQTGFTRYGDEPGAIFDYNRIHLLAWQMAAHDAKAMYFWQWRPHMDEWQGFGRGLVATDGTLTGRAKAAGDAARALNSDPDLFLDSKPVAAQVAVVYDIAGGLKLKAQGGDWGSYYARNLIGIYHALWNDQVRINVLDSRELTAESLKPYKLVIFPPIFASGRMWLTQSRPT